jgi:hypothetical protein
MVESASPNTRLRTADRVSGLVGNRLALAGTILYLLEWVAIAFLGFAELPTDLLGEDPAAIVQAYGGQMPAIALGAGWFSVVLTGRILFVAALRKAFRDSGRESAILDFAVGAMIMSVAIEVVAVSFPAVAAVLVDNGADSSVVVTLDSTASILFMLVFGPLGVSVLAGAALIMTTGLFRGWLGWLGIIAGILVILFGILGVAALGNGAGLLDRGAQLTGIGVPLFWIWMIATSVILWRRRPRGALTYNPG